MLVHPADFRVAQQKNAAQDDFADALRMGLGVGERQSAAPGSAEYEPTFDAEMLAQPLDVGDQVPGRVFDQARARAAAAAAALIEHHDAIMMRIEELPGALVGTRTGAAMQEHGGLAGRIAAFLVINLVDFGNAQVTGPERLDCRVEFAAHRGLRDPRGACAAPRARRRFCGAAFSRR